MDRTELAGMIDQTLLKPTAGYNAARDWMEAQRDAGFATLCVSPFLVPLASELLAGTPTRVCTVVGFPLGYALTETKVEEARHLVGLGAVEIDMVINIAAVIEGEVSLVRDDVAAVVAAVREASSGDGARQGHPRDRLPRAGADRLREPRVRRRRGGLRQDVDRLRPAGRERRGRAHHARSGRARASA